jgi:hypothetical protein
MKTGPSFIGSLLVWEPDSKVPGVHRLIDSERPSTSYFKYGSLTIEGETLFFEKKRNFIRVLAFAALTPVWGAVIIGLSYPIWWLSPDFTQKYAGRLVLIDAVLVISAFILALRKFIKPIRRRFSRAEIANVRAKEVQRPQFLNAGAAYVAVDFSVIPSESMIAAAQKTGSLPVANAEKCTFVTFVAYGGSLAMALQQWLPATQVALAGNLNGDIPPQQAAPRSSAQTEASGRSKTENQGWRHSPQWRTRFQTMIRGLLTILIGHHAAPKNPQAETTNSYQSSSGAGTKTEKRYSHNASMWLLGGSAAWFGVIAFWVGRDALTNNRGLILNGIHMGVTGATIFYFLVAAFCGVFFAIISYSLLQTIFNPHSLLLNQEGITFFKGWLKPKKVFVPFHAIDNLVQQQGVKGGKRTLILMVKGQKFPIREMHLSHPTFYPEICQAIAMGQQNARKKNEQPAPKPATPAPASAPVPNDDSRYMPKR